MSTVQAVVSVRRSGNRAGGVICAELVLLGVIIAGRAPWALAVAIVLPVGMLVMNRPQRGILLLVALAPFNGLLLIVPHPGFVAGWKEALTLATFLATFLCPEAARAARGRTLPGWSVAVVILGVAACVTMSWVSLHQGVIGLKIGFFYLFAAATVWRCPLDAGERDALVSTLMVAGVITAVFGLAQEVLGASRVHDLGYDYNTTIRFAGGFFRAFSTFSQPFPFGFFMMLVLLIGVPASLADLRRFRSVAFLVCTPLLGLAMAVTIVRGAWLGFAVGIAYLGSQRYRLLLLAIPLALVGLLLLPPELSASALSSGSSKERAIGWQENAVTVTRHPFGVGVGASGAAAEKLAEGRRAAGTYQPDNYYFKTVLELGPLGLWALALLLVAAFTETRRASQRLEGLDSVLAEGASAMVLAAAVSSTVATYFEIFPMDLLFWVLLAVVATCDVPSR